ncbi:MAG: hypothetical protein QOD72_1754, partial [Acidimicrobiaceae bacterium]|nr:hypothetical protein [Acidimicrobiaceae bacterium]
AVSNHAVEAMKNACAADASVVQSAQEAREVLTGSFAPDVASLVPDFIRSAPTTSMDYVITTDISGTVYVASAAGGPAEPATSQPSPCGSIT